MLQGAAHHALNDFGAAVEGRAAEVTPTDSGIQAALADAQAAGERKKREALMMPAVMELRGAGWRRGDARREAARRRRRRARSALAAMEELAGQQGGGELSRRSRYYVGAPRMEEQLVEVTKKGRMRGGES